MIMSEKELEQKSAEIEEKLCRAQSLAENKTALSWFCDDFALRFCWSSNAIEGNTLSLEETAALIEYDEVRSGHTYSEYQEAKNLYRAISETMIPFKKQEITEEWIKKNNALIINGDGEYRKGPVKIGNLIETVYVPPSAEKIPSLMNEFLQTVNFKAETVFEIINAAANLHMKFERIHPFADGNGRTGRMILNQQLINCGLLPIALNKTGSYRRSFKIYGRNGDTSLLVHEILSEEASSIERLLEFHNKIKEEM